jgi:RND superfamily putative drug exporter
LAVLATALVLLALCTAASAGGSDRWSNGGYTATGTEAARAERAAAPYGAGTPDLLFYARPEEPVDARATAAQGRAITARIAAHHGVVSAVSYWSTGLSDLKASDGRGALIRVVLAGDDSAAADLSRRLVPEVLAAAPALRLEVTGSAWINVQATRTSQSDLLRCELIAAPLTLLVLALAFSSLTAALVPVAIGALAVTASLTALAALTHQFPISIFAMNVCAALGFGLTVDYALFIVTRFREEVALGADVPTAIGRSMATAGRAVLFSALTVALCLSALLVFPVNLLRSLACASIIVVTAAALCTLIGLPAVLGLVGTRMEKWDPFARWRRRRTRESIASPTWGRVATAATGRPWLWGGCAAVLMLAAALPLTHARFTTVDENTLPPTASARHTADRIRTDFAHPPERLLLIVLPRTDAAAHSRALDTYARRISRLPGVTKVASARADYRAGLVLPGTLRVVPPRAPGQLPGTLVGVISTHDDQAPETVDLLHALRAEVAPGPHAVAGSAAQLADTNQAVRHALPAWLSLMLLSTVIVLFALTRSILVPLKAAVMGLLTMAATVGILVFVFQQGRLGVLVGNNPATGSLESTMPLLTCAVAYGISLDYEVFLLTRIKESYDLHRENRQAIIFGIQHTGRLFSAAALVVATTMASLAMSSITPLQVVGVGMTAAVLIDATVVRGVLVPSIMQLTGRWNWWSPFHRPPKKFVSATAEHAPTVSVES